MAEGTSRGEPRPGLMALIWGMVILAGAVTGVAVVELLLGGSLEPWRPLAAFLIIAAGWRLQCFVRVGGDRIVFFWGDAAMVLSAGLVSPAWLIVVTGPAVGAVLGLLPGRQPAVKAAYNTATAVIASAVALGVLAAVGATPLQMDSIRDITGLGLAAVVYVVISDLATSAVVAVHAGRGFWEVQGENRLLQAVSLLGNLGAAAAVWVTVALDPRLVIVAGLAVLGIQQGYVGIRRVQYERRRRQELAFAVSRLSDANGSAPDELTRGAVTAVGGDDMRSAETVVLRRAAEVALELFSADAVEIELHLDDAAAVTGQDATWLYRRSLRPIQLEELGFGGAVGPKLVAHSVAVLRSNGVHVGTLRLGFACTVKSDGLDEREQGDLAAFAAAIPAALQVAHHQASERRLRTDAEHRARHDALTGLANRHELLEVAASRLIISEADVQLTLVEVTGLRELTSTLGHAAADRLTTQTAQRLSMAADPHELVARLDAGRFAVLGSTSQGAPVAQRARDVLAVPVELSSGAVALTTVVGTAAAQRPTDAAELLRCAEVALAAAHGSPNRIAAYEQALDVESLPRMMLATKLLQGLRDGGLKMGYQLARDLVTRAPTSIEAVPVWTDAQLGSVDADDLLDLVGADVPDLQAAYLNWLLATVLEDCRRWGLRSISIPVAVRIPRRTLLDPALPSLVARRLSNAGLAADHLVISVDDAMPTATLLDVTDIVTALAEHGVQIAVGRLDVLEQLPTLPVSQLRLPADVISRVTSSQRAAALVEGTIATAARLGLHTTARGIDNDALAIMLRDMGCAAGQGEHIAPTMDADSAGRHLWAAEVTSGALHPPADLVVLARRRQRRRPTS